MSAKSKRGRPAKNENKVTINDLVVEYLATKDNDYNANICYFKVVDVECKTKLTSINGLHQLDSQLMLHLTHQQTQARMGCSHQVTSLRLCCTGVERLRACSLADVVAGRL